ncbi:hypothetical protein CGGC5_v011005 [Colletotrichum fructicola Nara gc5]|uniref:C2H2 finger domain-containing protein n=1 Tax=Colletotrichum fructicola (strain Nara gc5) TaxID=1213859 RepID=A0A7J6IWT9_COLFN|nr:hypothetical protein CGGC5_v011005 [Colletotrichum fructicola Nara gc5]
MSSRQRRNADAYDSDASFSPDDDCDVSDRENGLDNVASNDEAFCEYDDAETICGEDDADADGDGTLHEDDDFDVEDQVMLFDGNVHPPEYWLRELENFNEDAFACQDYSPGTTLLLDAVEEQWQQYCKVIKRDVQQCYATISTRLLHTFFDWFLSQKVGKDGRKKRGIRKKSSLGTYWKVFRLVYERAICNKVDSKLNRSMHREGFAIFSEEQIETTLSTTKKSFKLGELRILAVLYLLLLAPAGSRPKATLDLRFKDVKVALARDPEGGPHKLLVRFTPEFTKTYLGEKEQKTYTIPETMFDPSLLLSPHVFLLGILFRHRAFRAPSLTSPHHLRNLDIHPGERELPLPLREDLGETYIFRRAVETLTGYQISPNERISSGMMAAWIKRIGEILGFEYPTIAYNLRYNAANAFDQSVDVSEALRNLAMGHGNSDPFQRHYLGRNISADLWGILRGQKPQQALLKQSCSIGHSISQRRPIDLTAEQSASVLTHPTIRSLTKAAMGLRPGSQQYKDTKRAIRNEKQRLRRELKQTVRDEWTDEQATDDIERQIHGVGFSEPSTGDFSRPQQPAQKRLLTKLTAPLVATLEGQYCRRDNAIEAVSAYCTVQEGCAVRRPQHGPKEDRIPPSPVTPREGSSLYEATLSVFVANKKERPRRCFVCIGQALCLPADDEQRLNELSHEFYTPSDLTKHFRLCDVALKNKMHFQRHAIEVHGTVT